MTSFFRKTQIAVIVYIDLNAYQAMGKFSRRKIDDDLLISKCRLLKCLPRTQSVDNRMLLSFRLRWKDMVCLAFYLKYKCFVLIDQIVSETICLFYFCDLFSNIYPYIKFSIKFVLTYAVSIVMYFLFFFFFFSFFFFKFLCKKTIFNQCIFCHFSIVNKMVSNIYPYIKFSIKFVLKYSRLSLSRIPWDSMKHFEISVLRHIRSAELRKTINPTTTFNRMNL